MEIIKLDIDNSFPLGLSKEIDSLAKNQNFSPIWQTISWNSMVEESGNSVKGIFIGVLDDEEKLVNYVIIEKRFIGFGRYGNFIIGSCMNEEGKDILEEEIIRVGIDEKAIFTQLENLNEIKLKNAINKTYKKFIEKYTAIIDLSQSEDSILANMKQKGRYNIKIAQKNGVKVEFKQNTEENLDIFYDLLSETKDRDDFSVNSKEFYRIFLDYLYSNDLGGLYFAEKEGETLAGGIFTFYGKTCIYYYGASTSDNEKRKYMPTYLLQWEVILIAKSKGYKYFDFLGIAGPGDNTNKLSGVTDFKLKLTNETKIWPGGVIFIHNSFFYSVLKAKQFIKKLLKK